MTDALIPTEIIDPIPSDFERLNFDQRTWDRFASGLNVKNELEIEALRMALAGYNSRDCWEERMRLSAVMSISIYIICIMTTIRNTWRSSDSGWTST